ncbi:hypothetical protein BKA80DRAFT_333868 [Phyllosticta citrichinensis]
MAWSGVLEYLSCLSTSLVIAAAGRVGDAIVVVVSFGDVKERSGGAGLELERRRINPERQWFAFRTCGSLALCGTVRGETVSKQLRVVQMAIIRWKVVMDKNDEDEDEGACSG